MRQLALENELMASPAPGRKNKDDGDMTPGKYSADEFESDHSEEERGPEPVDDMDKYVLSMGVGDEEVEPL